MSELPPAPPQPPGRVPTLTEVIAWPDAAPNAPPSAWQQETVPLEDGALEVSARPDPALAPKAIAAAGAPNAPTARDEQITQDVLAAVQRQVDLMLEYRIREVLTPLLARLTDHLVRDARNELASALRDAVNRAVAHEVARHRGAPPAR